MKFSLCLIFCSIISLLSFSQNAVHADSTESLNELSVWKVKLSPINWFDNSSGDNISIQLEYLIGKYGICIENNFYQNLRRDRFYSMAGNRTSLEFRKYKNIAYGIKDKSRYQAIEFSYKSQDYQTLGYIVNDRLDTNYFNDLQLKKKVYMLHFKVGTGGKINSFTEIELAVGLGVRYRLMQIEGLKYEGDQVGTWMQEQHGTYKWMDHEKSGFYPSFSVNLRFGIHINELISTVKRKRRKSDY